MNPIKEFFKKRRFKNAGPGHRLDESTSAAAASRSNAPKKTSAPKPHFQSDASQHAAQAALARLEQKQKSDVNWSLAAIRAQARKELDLELQASDNVKHRVKPVYEESCSLLAVSGVYFSCPMIGPDILPYHEIFSKIKEFLYSQLEEERGLTACLIIHSCNKNKEKVQLGIETLSRYLTNILDNPTEKKFQKIRVNNKAFQERVGSLEGAYDFILASGFERQTLQQGDAEEEYFVFPEDRLSDLENLQMLKEALHSAEPLRPMLDRNKKLLMPSQSAEKINLPSDFFNLTTEELLKEQEDRSQAVEINSQLRTKAMRERDEIKEMRMYRYSLVRIKFPDGLILQGTFNVREKFGAITEFIIENLADPGRAFTLLAPGSYKLEEEDSTLLDLKLIPAVLLTLKWQNEDRLSGEEVAYLRSEVMCLLQSI